MSEDEEEAREEAREEEQNGGRGIGREGEQEESRRGGGLRGDRMGEGGVGTVTSTMGKEALRDLI